MPTGLLHAPAGIPRSEQRNVPARLRGLPRRHLRPGRAPRRHDARTTSRPRSTIPNTFPRFAGQGFAERADKDLALALPPDLQRLDDRRVVRRRRPRPADPAHARAAVGSRRSPPRRCGAARRRAATRSRSARTRRSSASRRCTSGEWDVLWDGVRGDRHHGVDAHRVVVDACRPRRPTRRSPRRCRSTPQNAAGVAVRLGVLRHAVALPRRSRSPTPRARSGWMPYQLERMDSVWRDGVGRRRAPGRAERAGEGPGVRAACSTTCIGLKTRDEVGPRADPVRDRLPALRRHVPALAQGRPPAVRGRGHGRGRVPRGPARQRDRRATASSASASRAVSRLRGRTAGRLRG